METVAKRLYEAMFLVDSAQAAADWEGTLSVINNILQRADAEVVSMRKWQERKLAYDIDRKTRGTYILCYFKADGRRIRGIEKDVQLSEKVMRVLVLTTEKRPADMLERDITGAPEEKPAESSSETSETPTQTEAAASGEKASETAKPPATPEAPAPEAQGSADTGAGDASDSDDSANEEEAEKAPQPAE